MSGKSSALVTNANDLAIKLKPDNSHGRCELSVDGSKCVTDATSVGKAVAARGHGDAGKGLVYLSCVHGRCAAAIETDLTNVS